MSKSTTPAQKQEFLLEFPNQEPRIYDVTNFIKSHPGGSIIRFFVGQDATDAFTEFHFRSEKAKKMLKAIPSREPSAEELAKYRGSKQTQALLKDFRKLRQEFVEEGIFDNSVLHIMWRLFELVAMTVFGFILCAKGHFWVGCGVLGIAMGRYGWLMHESGHFSLVGNIKLDKMLQAVLYGVGCGCSGSFWTNQHNKHHATPQKIGHDVDLNTLPFVAFNDEVAKKGAPGVLKYQHILYFSFLEAVGLLWTLMLHPRHSIRTKQYWELPLMAVNHVLRLYAGYLYDGTFTSAIIAYFLIQTVLVVYIFGNFTLSHTHMPYLMKDEHTDWVHYSADYTLNIEPSLAVNWWMSYLNFQIEHHLFPSMPQYKIPRIKDRVQSLFEKHGITYHCCGYFEAWGKTLSNMKRVGENRAQSAKKSKMSTKKEE